MSQLLTSVSSLASQSSFDDSIFDFDRFNDQPKVQVYSNSQYLGAAYAIMCAMMNHKTSFIQSVWTYVISILGAYKEGVSWDVITLEEALVIIKTKPIKDLVNISMLSLYNEMIEAITVSSANISLDNTCVSFGVNSSFDMPFGPLDFGLIINGEIRRRTKFSYIDDYTRYVDLSYLVSGNGSGKPVLKGCYICDFKVPVLSKENNFRRTVSRWDVISLSISINYPQTFDPKTVKGSTLDGLVDFVYQNFDTSSFNINLSFGSSDYTKKICARYNVQTVQYSTLLQFLKDGNFFNFLNVDNEHKINIFNVQAFLGIGRFFRKDTILDEFYGKRSDGMLFERDGEFHYNDVTVSKLGLLWNMNKELFTKINYVGVTTKGMNSQAVAVRTHFNNSEIKFYDKDGNGEENSKLKANVYYLDVSTALVDPDIWSNALVINDAYPDDNEIDTIRSLNANVTFASQVMQAGAIGCVFKGNVFNGIPKIPDYVVKIFGHGSIHNGEVFFAVFADGIEVPNGIEIKDVVANVLVGNYARGYRREIVSKPIVDGYYYNTPLVLRCPKSQLLRRKANITLADIDGIEEDFIQVPQQATKFSIALSLVPIFKKLPNYDSIKFESFVSNYRNASHDLATIKNMYAQYISPTKVNVIKNVGVKPIHGEYSYYISNLSDPNYRKINKIDCSEQVIAIVISQLSDSKDPTITKNKFNDLVKSISDALTDPDTI